MTVKAASSQIKRFKRMIGGGNQENRFLSLLFGIIRHFFISGRGRLPRSFLFEDGVNGVAEFAGDGADGGEMVLAASAEGLVILREDGVAKGRPGGGQPDGPSEIG